MPWGLGVICTMKQSKKTESSSSSSKTKSHISLKTMSEAIKKDWKKDRAGTAEARGEWSEKPAWSNQKRLKGGSWRRRVSSREDTCHRTKQSKKTESPLAFQCTCRNPVQRPCSEAIKKDWKLNTVLKVLLIFRCYTELKQSKKTERSTSRPGSRGTSR